MTTLYAYQGKDFSENAIYLDSSGNPMNVIGHTSYIKIAKYYDSTEDTLTVNGTIVSPSTSGIFFYTSPKANISAMKHGNHVYTRYLVDSSNNVISVVSGDFVVVPAVL